MNREVSRQRGEEHAPTGVDTREALLELVDFGGPQGARNAASVDTSVVIAPARQETLTPMDSEDDGEQA